MKAWRFGVADDHSIMRAPCIAPCLEDELEDSTLAWSAATSELKRAGKWRRTYPTLLIVDIKYAGWGWSP